jgi:cobalt ECF transporter T component CbiQ
VRHESFIESTLRGFARAFSKVLISEQAASQPGLLQCFDPRVRVVGVLALATSVVLCRKLAVIAFLMVLTILLAIASRLSIWSLARRVWFAVLGFTGPIALPALFITPGSRLFLLPGLHLSVSAQGVQTAALLVLRVETVATLTAVLVLCTPWTYILKALRLLRLPAEIVTMLAMTHRYVFLLIETANQMFDSRQSRTVGKLTGPEKRRMTARTAGVLLSKSVELSHEVYMAMLSRGFDGEVRLLNDFRLRTWDYLGLTGFISAACLAVWMGK